MKHTLRSLNTLLCKKSKKYLKFKLYVVKRLFSKKNSEYMDIFQLITNFTLKEFIAFEVKMKLTQPFWHLHSL